MAKPAHKVKLEEGVTFDGPPPRAEATWHPSAQIVYPAPGKKDILLNSQTEELQAVLRHGIGLVKTGLLFENAYPAIISRAGFARSYLISSAEAFPKAKHIRERLGLDLKYAAILADIVNSYSVISPILTSSGASSLTESTSFVATSSVPALLSLPASTSLLV